MESVNKDKFEEAVLKSEKPVLVDFWAEWCGPCKMLAPELEKASKALEGKVKFVKLNVEEGQEIAQNYGVMGIPCLILFNKGEPADERIFGFQPYETIIKKVEEQIA